MTPLQYYQQHLQSGLIDKDAQQAEVIELLQKIYDDLEKQAKPRRGVLKRFKQRKAVEGLYVWGSVGVGKTFLMDCFYTCYLGKKLRFHFHHFLARVQAELKAIQGQVDPLRAIAKKIKAQADVLCFDEFFVSNIADAMILGELFAGLFHEGVSLVTTSNVRPDDLYKDGLQRERFLPAIAAIKANTRIYHMISHHDYRLTHAQQAGVYFTPISPQTEGYLSNVFQHLANEQEVMGESLVLFGRNIPTVKRTAQVIWFEFMDICGVPRSQLDYIELAKMYRTVFISKVPVFQAEQLNLTTAFINLIDVLYDAGVRVIMQAEAEIEHLYPHGQLKFEFARTQSRLIEMQSVAYFHEQRNL